MIVFKCVLFDTPAPGFSLHHRVNPSVGSSKTLTFLHIDIGFHSNTGFFTPALVFLLQHRVNPSVGSSKPSAQPPGCHPPSQVLLDCQNKLREACGWGGSIVGKKWDPGILDPGPFSGQIRKKSWDGILGKFIWKIRKVHWEH